MVSRLWWIIPLLIVVLVGAAYVVGGRPRPVARVSGRVSALTADAGGLLGLEARQPDSPAGGSLFALPGGEGVARPLCPSEQIADLAPAGDRVLALAVAADGQSGSLVDLPRAGGTAEPRVTGLSRPQSLLVDGGNAYWTEALAAAAPHIWHVPAMAPKVLLRSCALKGDGTPRLLAVTEGSLAGFRGKLFGVVDDRFYWMDYRGAASGWGWSVTRAVPLAGGTVQAIRTDQGPQTGLIHGRTLYATAPSEDAGDPLRFCCVRRSSPPEAAPATLTDWLWPGGTLCAVNGRIYYASQDGVWAVPERLARPRQLQPVGAASGLAAARAGAVYEVASGPKGGVISRRPVTAGARLRAALQLIARH